MDDRLWIIIIAPVVWLLSMMRDVSAIAKLIPIGVVAAILSCVLIIANAGMDSQLWEDWSPEEVKQLHNVWPVGSFMSLGSLTATAFGAFGCVGILPAIIDEMKSQDRFKRSFRTALSIVMVLYICIMLVGYHAYGNFIQPNILKSMTYHPSTYEESSLPPEEWTGRHSNVVPTAMSCCMLVNLVISYPLLLAPVFIAIQRTPYGKENLQLGSKRNLFMRTTIVLLTVAIPLVFDDFSLIFDLFASICMPVQGVLIPIVFGSKIRKKVGAEDTCLSRKILHVMMSTVAIFCMIIGLTDSMSKMVHSFGR
jgi:amino acid permease